jgi:hypothetical protein
VCNQVFTHFIREEDAEMVSGRLDEELKRTSVIADRIGPHSLVADSTLFLRAPRQPDGQRTVKLAVADPLPTSYGEDICVRIGGWLGEPPASRPASVAQG